MINKLINKKINILSLLTILLFLVIALKITNIQVINHKLYIEKYQETLKYIYSLTAPRGRIYDCNGILLVDNETVKIIRYSNINTDSREEKEIAKKVAAVLNEDYLSILKKMRSGYSYDIKTIKENPTDEQYALLSELNLNGIILDKDWKRVYKTKYFTSILGNVGQIPAEKKDYYLDRGYSLNDRVGISFIEEAYDRYLKGEKDKYVLKDGEYKLVKEGNVGKDIYLTIDIKLQERIEQILEKEIKRAKKEKNSEYYDHSYVIVSNPNTGAILAMAGKKIVGDKFVDITPEILTSTIQGGSAVKGASNMVGYRTGTLKIGDKRKDFCIKLKNLNAKCSWKKLGTLNDVTALKYSSNSFQYQTVIKVGKGTYRYNQKLVLEDDTLNTYRSIFSEFGLGVKTGIDLKESSGYRGNKNTPELVLDFSVGQYDTYTPLQLNQYISTIANNGYRLKPQLMKGYLLGDVFIPMQKKILNELNDKAYISQVKKGFRMVMETGGTGYNYIAPKYKAAGKTGTSTSYLDLNNDGIVETPTTSNIFLAYAPYDNPIVSFLVISPNVKLAYSNSTYKTAVNRKISYEVARNFFEIYK